MWHFGASTSPFTKKGNTNYDVGTFPAFGHQQQKPYWMLYGLDQLLHLLVIVIIWYYCI